MKDNILLINLRCLGDMAEAIEEENPGILVSKNFEDILGRAKLDEIGKLCIVLSAYNYSGSDTNTIDPQTAAELIHAVQPEIPIMCWGGRTKRSEFEDPTKDNELILDVSYYGVEECCRIIKKFYSGTLTVDDIPMRQCLKLNWLECR